MSYMYPTIPDWFPELLDEWKGTGKNLIAFPFDKQVSTLPQKTDTELWLYLYNTLNKTDDPNLAGTVQFRVHVVRHGFDQLLSDPNTHVRSDWNPNSGTWFVCDVVEEIRHIDGSFLLYKDFEHSEGKALGSVLQATIAPVRRISPFIVVGRYLRELHD